MAKAEPKMYYFVSNRDVTITSTRGYSIAFVKGVPMHVPKPMHPEVMERGCLPCDKDGKQLSADEQPMQEEPTILIEPEDADERNEKIEAAIRSLVARNNPRDFSAGGVPSAASLTAAVGWKVDSREIRPIWAKMKPDLVKVS